MTLAAGQSINEHVRLVRPLGRGGMGAVWVAHHEKLALDVAVKLVASELLKTEDPIVMARFQREAQLAARLSSPHIVRVLDHGITGEGQPYIVMELLEGESVAERLAKQRRLPLAQVVEVVSGAANGLEHAHALGIVHRDIKPANLFFARGKTDERTVKIVDFGIAKSNEQRDAANVATSSGVLIGTPQYMSPEQLMRAGPADKSADVWALSVVAYELLTGKLPFVGETLAATLVAITRADVAPPTKAVPGLSSALDAFFVRAFAVDPERRFPSARALAEAFASAAEGANPAEVPTLTEVVSGDQAAVTTAEFLLQQDARTKPAPSAQPAASSAEPAADVAFLPTEPNVELAPRRELAPPVPSRRAPRSRWLAPGLLVGGAALGAGVVAMLSRPLPAPPPAVERTGSLVPSSEGAPLVASASVRVEPTSSATVRSRVGVISKLSVPAGVAPQSALFVPAFEVGREEGDLGNDFLGATSVCERRRMALCSESQWLRACELSPNVGAEPSWTATPGHKGLVVRGGAAGCNAQAIAAFDDKAKDRIAVCCSRAVAVRSSNQNRAFLLTTAGKILSIERTLNAANGLELANMALPTTNFFGRMLNRDELIQTASWVGKNGAFLFDSCDVEISDQGVERRWTAECTGVLKTPTVARKAHRWITISDGGQLSELREPKATSPLRSD